MSKNIMKGLEEIKNSIDKISAIEVSSEDFYNNDWIKFEEDLNDDIDKFKENHELSESDKDELEESITEIFEKLFELDVEYFNDDICETIENIVTKMLDKIGRLNDGKIY